MTDADGYSTDVGELNLAAALPKATPQSTQSWSVGTGTGSMDKARGTNKLTFNGIPLATQACRDDSVGTTTRSWLRPRATQSAGTRVASNMV